VRILRFENACPILWSVTNEDDESSEEEPAVKLANVRLLVSDFPASYAFWRDVMQLPVAYGPETPNAPAGYAYLTLGDSGIELFNRDGFAQAIGQAPTPAPASGQMVIVLKVDDVDATYAALTGRGAPSVAVPQDRPEWGARTAHISDSDGNLIELYIPLGGS
jgi:catechol 2,3-dioxygenase-like lactoylglutathione lyase family enzyme